MDFFNNKNNDVLKFKLNVEGIDTNNIEPRLIFKSNDGNINYTFFGKIKENVCVFDIPELKLYEKDSTGTVKFEIVSDDDMYFKVWNEKFEIKTKQEIKLDEMIYNTIKEDIKPKAKISLVNENVIVEKVKKEEVKEVEKEIVKDVKKEFKTFRDFGK